MHTCCAHSLSLAWHSMALLCFGHLDMLAPSGTLAQPRPVALLPAQCPAQLGAVLSCALWACSMSPPAGHGGTDLCRCRGCSSSFWKQMKQKESITQHTTGQAVPQECWHLPALTSTAGSRRLTLACLEPWCREPFTQPG